VPRARITKPVGLEGALFGERLRELRQKRGMTLRELTDVSGMSLAYLSDLERGLKIPSLTSLIRLAVALECKISALVGVFDKTDLAKLLPK